RVYCDTNYYGPTCGTYCIPRDDNYNGHYTCDSNTGNKICRSYWTGSNCRTPICKSGCSSVHGFCYTPQTCECYSGWRLPDCTQCIPKPGC
ncbi:predicted protein, partial [Nematostella vectensis]